MYGTVIIRMSLLFYYFCVLCECELILFVHTTKEINETMGLFH